MIIYASRTGNVRYIVEKLGIAATPLEKVRTIDEPYILFTYSDALGAIPVSVLQFLQQYAPLCVGTFISGNRNFGPMFAGAGKQIEQQFHIPLLYAVDLRGFTSDYEALRKIYNEMMVTA